VAVKVALFSRYPVDFTRPKGGVESVAVVLARALAQLEHLDVHVVTLERERAQIQIEHDEDVKVHRLPGSGWPQILDIHLGPGKKRLINYVKDLKPDILHTHETYGLTLGSISIPHVFTVHGFDHANLIAESAKLGRLRSWMWKRVEKRGLSGQRHIISISPYVTKMIEQQTDANIYDIDNPVDERFFKIERRPESFRILCVGWISERKNTLAAVEAFAKSMGICSEARLVIAGEPKEAEYWSRVKEVIARHGIGEKIEILGHINHVQLENELARASVFLLPSRQENAPMAIAETMAAGIPVVASNRCGMPYMIRDGESGFLVDPDNSDDIARRLKQLLSDDELRKAMGSKGRKIALDRFHPAKVAKRTRDVYLRAISEAKR